MDNSMSTNLITYKLNQFLERPNLPRFSSSTQRETDTLNRPTLVKEIE